MDSVAKLSDMASTEVLKEPRGFIKCIQIVIAIFAFATATAYYGSTSYKVLCTPGGQPHTSVISFGYPYRLDTNKLIYNVCRSENASQTPLEPKMAYGDYTSASEFYVFVGVTAFLFSLGTLIFYVFSDRLYQTNDNIPIADFIVTAIYVLLWLISSSAWADAVSKIKHYSDPKDYFKDDLVCECADVQSSSCTKADTCEVTYCNFATINVSVIFGFLCMCIWAGNLWFLYKETKWFKGSRDDQIARSQPSTPGSIPQQI